MKLALSDIGVEDDERESGAEEILYLLPQEITTDERWNVRRFDLDNEHEIERIDWLAQSMERDGQHDYLILVPDEDGRLVLLMGHRRRRAATLINGKRAINHQPLFRLKCRIDRTGGDLLRKALSSNLQRQQLSPMEIALNIRRVLTENHWDESYQHAKKVAEYLGVSPATVTQYKKFLLPVCDDETRRKLHRGEISVETALHIMNSTTLAQRREVHEKAADIQTANNIDRAMADMEEGRIGAQKAAERIQGQKHRVERPAVEEAIREVTGKPVAMKRNEIVGFFEEFELADYPEPVKQFIEALLALFAGTAGPRGRHMVVAKFKAMVKAKGKAAGA